MDTGAQRDVLVLMVDDDPDLLELAVALLEAASLRVVTATDGRKALHALDAVRPDVIVIDMMMPELDGLGFLHEYATRPAPRAPVIAVSAFAPYLEEARNLGASAALRKPYDPHQLIALVRSLAAGQAPEVAPPLRIATEDEQARLRALFDLRLDELAPEPKMERFLDELADVFEVPLAGISAVMADHQRLVTTCSGVPDDPGSPREQAFCTHAVAARSALVIQDAAENPFFRDNPEVTVGGFRFYAGVPLVTSRGETVGTLCILDFKPHSFTHFDLELLGLFAQRVMAALELRDKRRNAAAPETVYCEQRSFDEELDIYGKPLFGDLIVVESSRCMLRGESAALVVASVPSEQLPHAADMLRTVVRGGLVGRVGRTRLGVIVAGQHAAPAEDLVRRACGNGVLVAGTDLDRYQGGATGLALVRLEQTLDAAAAA